jgi:cell wall-associated NlpC family hydrolase
MYIGNGKIIHAQTPQHGIGITTANIMVKMGARRII